MAITASGFDGSIDESQFAKLMTLAGVRYAVAGTADFKVTAVGGSRAVSVAAGQAYGVGVLAVNSAAVTVALPSPTAGQWHLIALRRDWTANTCVLVSVPHSTTTNVAQPVAPTTFPTLDKNPGTADHQPLYWAWVNVTTTAVTLFDIRELTAENRIMAVEAQMDSFEASYEQRLELVENDTAYLYREVPAPRTDTAGESQVITADSYSNLPQNSISMTYNLQYPCWVRMECNAWLGASASDVRMGIKVSGATVSAPISPEHGAEGRAAAGQGTLTVVAHKTLKLNAGSNSITVQAMRSVKTGSQTVSYAVLTVTPLSNA